jgi:hypothetical protein
MPDMQRLFNRIVGVYAQSTNDGIPTDAYPNGMRVQHTFAGNIKDTRIVRLPYISYERLEQDFERNDVLRLFREYNDPFSPWQIFWSLYINPFTTMAELGWLQQSMKKWFKPDEQAALEAYIPNLNTFRNITTAA